MNTLVLGYAFDYVKGGVLMALLSLVTCLYGAALQFNSVGGIVPG